MKSWRLTVGMEVHIELKTKTKMFCGCLNQPFESLPNQHICPVCYGLPGALPVINRQAVEMTIKLGRALKGEIAPYTYWERKNYFYPDLPKGYQISQSVLPLVKNAQITIDGEVHHIEHIHLEEDAGKLIHDKTIRSLCDFNRAGVPLIELVTEPDFDSATKAKRFCEELRQIVRVLEISDADMEKGQMRCEANISVGPIDGRNQPRKLGTKVEVKNINSFRAVAKAIEYEYLRQAKILEQGGKIVQETRTWQEPLGRTVSMRTKEISADYRYFPEPDLPHLSIDIGDQHQDTALPEDQRQQLVGMGFTLETAKNLVDKNMFPKLVEFHQNYSSQIKEYGYLLLENASAEQLSSEQAARLLTCSRQLGWTKAYLGEVIEKLNRGISWDEIINQPELDSSLEEIIKKVITNNPKALQDYNQGKENAFNFLIGQIMSQVKGRASINQVRSKLELFLKQD